MATIVERLDGLISCSRLVFNLLMTMICLALGVKSTVFVVINALYAIIVNFPISTALKRPLIKCTIKSRILLN